MQETQHNQYTTHEWNEIVWLIANGVRAISTHRLGERSVSFSFDTPDRCQDLIDDLHLSDDISVRIHLRTLAAIRRARSAVRNTP